MANMSPIQLGSPLALDILLPPGCRPPSNHQQWMGNAWWVRFLPPWDSVPSRSFGENVSAAVGEPLVAGRGRRGGQGGFHSCRKHLDLRYLYLFLPLIIFFVSISRGSVFVSIHVYSILLIISAILFLLIRNNQNRSFIWWMVVFSAKNVFSGSIKF